MSNIHCYEKGLRGRFVVASWHVFHFVGRRQVTETRSKEIIVGVIWLRKWF